MKFQNCEFNATGDPELDFTANDATPYLKNFRVAENYGFYKENVWQDKGSGFYQIKAFGDVAEHIYSSVKKGDRILITKGDMELQTYQNKEGKDVISPVIIPFQFFVLPKHKKKD